MKQETEYRYQLMAEQLIYFTLQLYNAGDEAPIEVAFSQEQSECLEAFDYALPHHRTPRPSNFLDLYHKLLHSLLFSIHPNVDANSEKDPMTIFMICINLENAMGNFKQPSMIATSCSTMLHIMRLVAVKEISLKRASDARPDATLQ
jgi:hypothetical protein